jgi:hypothetical protein
MYNKISNLMVLESAAGFYIGRMCDEGPYDRKSGYYPTRKAAQYALDHNEYYRGDC